MDIHAALQPLDFIVIGIYVFALLSIGLWVSAKNRGAKSDLFLGGRSMPWYNVGLSILINIGPSFLIASCSIAYTSGMVGANFEWLAWWFLMLLGMLFIPHYMRTKINYNAGIYVNSIWTQSIVFCHIMLYSPPLSFGWVAPSMLEESFYHK